MERHINQIINSMNLTQNYEESFIQKDSKSIMNKLQTDVKRINHRIFPSAILLTSLCHPFAIRLLSFCYSIPLPSFMGFI